MRSFTAYEVRLDNLPGSACLMAHVQTFVGISRPKHLFLLDNQLWSPVRFPSPQELVVQPVDFDKSGPEDEEWQYTPHRISNSSNGSRILVEERQGPFTLPLLRLSEPIGSNSLNLHGPMIGSQGEWWSETEVAFCRAGNELWMACLRGGQFNTPTLVFAACGPSPFASGRWPRCRIAPASDGDWIWTRVHRLISNKLVPVSCLIRKSDKTVHVEPTPWRDLKFRP